MASREMNNPDGKSQGRVLIVDDDEDVLQAARLLLKQHVASVVTETDPGRLPTLLTNDSFDAVMLDMNFTRDVTSGQEGFDWLGKILQIDPDAVVIMITAFGDADTAVKTIKAGATDFVIKPWHNEKLLATVSAAISLRRSRQEVDVLRTRQRQMSADIDQPYHDFIGSSPAMQQVFSIINKVAATDANVLILGENGTGKELAARAVHRQSNRRDDVFSKVDIGAITETLFESELFGHVKGAFTDAREDRPGRFEVASGGTIFLDEIGNLPMSLQAKLLTVLQSRHVTRVGSNTALPFDIRLICASNLALDEMAAQDKFREDLLYRVNTVELRLPALRERIDDIPVLADHFLNLYCRKYRKPVTGISQAAVKKLKKYDWPGNVRELQHSLERAVIMAESKSLQPEDFPFAGSLRRAGELQLGSFNLDEVEKTVIKKVLTQYGGNVSRAAEALGLTRTSLYRRMQKHDL